MRSLVILLLLLWASLAAEDSAPTVDWIPGSTLPLLQLTGEKFQFFSHDYYFKADAPAQTLTRFHAAGADLGVPVIFPDKLVLLFGDTWSYHLDSEGKYIWYHGWGKTDSIAYFDWPIDLSACHVMENIDRQIAVGTKPPIPDYSHAPKLKFYLKRESIPNQPLFQETAISNLREDQGVLGYEVPTGGFSLNDRIYMFYNVQHQETKDPKGKDIVFFLNSILAKSDQPCSEWKDHAPPTFTRLYDVSIHPHVDDPFHPPSDGKDSGKFIHVAPVVMDAARLKDSGLAPSLPPALQSAEKVIVLLGSSWRYIHSNLFLAVVDAKEIESKTAWWYFNGTPAKPEWTREEAAATPLLDTWELPHEPCLGEHSAIWCPELQRFVLAYQDRYYKIKFRTALSPIGPWSTETETFHLFDPWAFKFIHHPDKDPITQNCVTVYKPNGDPFVAPDGSGADYGPYLLDTSTHNADGSITLYFTMSTWNPYNVFLMKTSFRPKK